MTEQTPAELATGEAERRRAHQYGNPTEPAESGPVDEPAHVEAPPVTDVNDDVHDDTDLDLGKD